MLNDYLTSTQQLLANPAAPTLLYSTSDLTDYINTARTQLVGESGCIRAIGTLSVTSVTNTYNYTDIAGLPTGIQGVYRIRQMTRVSGTGFVYMGSRSYPWAQLYWLNNASPTPGAPTQWAEYKIATTGTLIVNPTPDQDYVLKPDVVCWPVALVDDTTAEAIPYPYTDAVPYFAAYYAYMSSQRQSDADKMYARYQEFLNRARRISVPNVLSAQYDQAISAPAAKTQPQPYQGGAG